MVFNSKGSNYKSIELYVNILTADRRRGAMIDIYLRELNKTWFGLAYVGEKIAATTVSSERQQALNSLLGSLPGKPDFRIVDEPSEFAENTVLALERLHRGIPEPETFALAAEYLTQPRATVLEIAAKIPVGYVASYGDIAKLAGTDARAVGQFMATNPVYPIVPCHRVIGSDFSLVGYGGGKRPSALKAKLSRLTAERKGFTSPKQIEVDGALLTVHPVERVLEKAGKQRLAPRPNGQTDLTSF